jgi:hypothetical protein
MDDSKKKRWTRPQLVVLARSTTDEAVLRSCKLPSRPYV